jgi:hypothetical protein
MFESLLLFNVLCNFFIYSLTIPSFRKFLKSKYFRGGPSDVIRNSFAIQGMATDANGMHITSEDNVT